MALDLSTRDSAVPLSFIQPGGGSLNWRLCGAHCKAGSVSCGQDRLEDGACHDQVEPDAQWHVPRWNEVGTEAGGDDSDGTPAPTQVNTGTPIGDSVNLSVLAAAVAMLALAGGALTLRTVKQR